MDSLLFYGYEFLTGVLPFLLALILFCHIHKRRNLTVSKYYYVLLAVFAFYIMGVFHFTGAGTLYEGLIYQFEMKNSQINFIPFSRGIDFAGYLLNILLFIPLGVLVPAIWKRMDRFFAVFGAGILFSALIEASQLLNNRSTDIDDLIVNTMGAILGFVIYKVWDRCTKGRFSLKGVPVVELPILIFVIYAGRFLLFNEMGLAGLLYGF